MLKKKVIVGFVILTLLITLSGCSSANNGKAKEETAKEKVVYLNMGATSASSSLYSYMVALADSIKKGTNGQINVNVVETGASKDNIIRMHKGQVDFGMADEMLNYKAINALDEFEKDPIPEIRSLFIYQLSAQPWLVTVNSGIENISELNGKKFMFGFRGSASESATEAIINALGIKPDVFRGALEDGVNAIKDRRLDGYVKTGTMTGPGAYAPDTSSIDINTTVPLKLIGYSPEEAKIIKDKFPGYPLKTIAAGSFFDNQTEDKVVHCLVMAIAASTKMTDEVAYQITKAMIDNKALQDQAYPSIKYSDYMKDSLEYLNTPLHAGAVKYYQEKGYTVPDRLIPPEMKK